MHAVMNAITAMKHTNRLFKSHLQIYKNLRLRTYAQESLKPAPKEVKKRKIKSSKDVEKHMNSSDRLRKVKDLIPMRFMKKNRTSPDDLYLVDSLVAKHVAEAIEPYVLKDNKTIIETNPGFGFITEELLKAGMDRAQLYESTVCFRNHILNLDKQYPGKLKVYNRDFFSIWKLTYQDKYDNGDRVKKMLSNVEIKQWDEDPAMTIIGTTASSNFIRHLLLSLIFQFGVMTYGRCELFLILPPYLYLQLTAGPEGGYLLYRASSVLFQLFCDHEVLLKVPRKAFLPWDNMLSLKEKSKMWKVYSVDPDCMYLTRIKFKRNLPVPMDKLQHLWYFIQHLMVSRTTRIIPTLEKWVPGCGIRLILTNSSTSIQQYPENNCIYSDINIYTQSGQLTAQQFSKLYNEFSSSSEYSESPFIVSMEAALLKMESMHFVDDQQHEDHEHGKESENLPESKNIEEKT